MTVVVEPPTAGHGSRFPGGLSFERDIDRDISRRLRTGEVRLLASLATGAPLAVVADALGMSERTVRRHIRNLCDELGVRTPIEAVVWATRRRVI